MPLPRRLKVALGEKIRVGDLEVVPEKVEQRCVVFNYKTGKFRPEISRRPAMVLTIRLYNASSNVTFFPTDPAFDQRSGPKQPGRPYTLLEVGGHRFYGGPIEWNSSRKGPIDEFIQGQEKNSEPLQAGEQKTTVFCTDPDDDQVIPTASSHTGIFLWRIRLRQGVLQVGDEETAASAVIGVQFEARDIRK